MEFVLLLLLLKHPLCPLCVLMWGHHKLCLGLKIPVAVNKLVSITLKQSASACMPAPLLHASVLQPSTFSGALSLQRSLPEPRRTPARLLLSD